MQVSRLKTQKAVLLTLSYSQVFSKPLTTEEILIRLLKSQSDGSNVDDDGADQALTALQAKKTIKRQGEYWYLNGFSNSISAIRKKRERLSEMKLRELSPFIAFAQNISWIKGIAVTGSVSVFNADAKDDVDLMIVVQSGRMWLVRPLLVLFSFFKGKRRSWNKEEYNSWCLNLWLEETALSVLLDKRSVYTAYEVCQAYWVISNQSIEEKFLKANSWVQRYIPNYFEYRLQNTMITSPATNSVSIFEGLFSSFNSAAYFIQRWYMQRHMTTERVGKTFAFFHPRDTKKSIFKEWRELLLQIF